jgi:putative pyruvate formate lyase activating enzyme
MNCLYCQNYPISQMGHGNEIEVADLTEVMLDLQRKGAHNINLVTATQFLPQAVEAIVNARKLGLTLPVVSNTSGYESVETVRMLDGLVQVYLVDMRYSRGESSARYSKVPDYPDRNRQAILEMLDQAGPLTCRGGLATAGVIIRHLLLPSLLAETREILAFIAREVPPSVPLSLMTQYFPANRAHDCPDLNRKISAEEYDEALGLLTDLGIETGWVQDPETPPGRVA